MLITDGEADISPEVVEAINHVRKEDSLHVYVVGIGDIRTKQLQPIADAIYTVSAQPERDSATVAPLIALVAYATSQEEPYDK